MKHNHNNMQNQRASLVVPHHLQYDPRIGYHIHSADYPTLFYLPPVQSFFIYANSGCQHKPMVTYIFYVSCPSGIKPKATVLRYSCRISGFAMSAK